MMRDFDGLSLEGVEYLEFEDILESMEAPFLCQTGDVEPRWRNHKNQTTAD